MPPTAPPPAIETNLPAPSTKWQVFSISTHIAIDAPPSVVWDALLDFPAYSAWNPFVSSQVVASADGKWAPLAEQTPKEGLGLVMRVHIPPLEEPLGLEGGKRNGKKVAKHQMSYETITAVDEERWRVAWKQAFLPGWLLDAERWQVLSVLPASQEAGEGGQSTYRGERTYYETREVFSGPLAYVVRVLYAKGLQAGFEAHARALKGLVEASERRAGGHLE
ncbi:hypothetical protein NLJ89_g3914 [Agrocybe chaxingu]|uniref:Coenzyme Q-binding protein COQ10 START domain-containing protein n=1 Tax=Agrocybe chaxingu TaxID=84603 RepID=A0A9W8K9C3_9AGAR|nr:hypothetical protein NLJ89_g3914 [Agrocybe chaxingu]